MINKKTPIKIYSPNIDLLGEIDDYTSFIFKRSYNEISEFSLYISLNKQNTEHLQKKNILMIDGNGDKTGMIWYREIKLDEKGNEILYVTGYTLNSILNKRIIKLPQNGSELIYTGNGIELMNKLVDENVVNPLISVRKIDNVIIEDNSMELGKNVLWKLEPRKVGDELSKIAKIQNVGFKMTLDVQNKKIIFKTYIGKDLTDQQSINPKVVFSPLFDNVFTMSYVDSDIDEKNALFIKLDNYITDYGSATGLDRQESYLDHGALQENETLEDIAENELSNYPAINNISAEIIPYNSFIYERDYNLGDIVVIENKKWNVKKYLRITSIEEVYESKNKINMVFGEPTPTFVKMIKNYITNMK